MIFLIIILVLIAIPLVAAALLADQYTVERDVIINQPVGKVFDYLKMIKNAEYYNKWVMLDPHSRRTFTGVDGTAGFVYTWDSDNKQVGAGEQEITEIREGQRIESELRFLRPFKNTAITYFTTERITPDQTRVRWVLTGPRVYVAKLMHFLLNLKKMLMKDMSVSLSNLKTILEKIN